MKILYNNHNYQAHQIWNCNQNGAQTSKDGGDFVNTKRESKNVHIVILDQ